ncbi:hypothetical protein BC835DRAFT_1318659 [Cytidiella melzeri]|nr:hypothetical protein BC835DRAFT_1318659 [Cytidiella melzeri]
MAYLPRRTSPFKQLKQAHEFYAGNTGFTIGVQLHAHGSGKHWQEQSGSIVLAPKDPSKRASKMRTAIVSFDCSNVLHRDQPSALPTIKPADTDVAARARNARGTMNFMLRGLRVHWLRATLHRTLQFRAPDLIRYQFFDSDEAHDRQSSCIRQSVKFLRQVK